MRIYYARPEIFIVSDPSNGTSPVLVLRHSGVPSKEEWDLIKKALKTCRMELGGEPEFRKDKLWYVPVKEV